MFVYLTRTQIKVDSGVFSTKSFIAATRTNGTHRKWATWIWSSFFPPSVSIFLWRLLRHGLPVDCHIRPRGITLSSRCRCCRTHEEETLDHLFVESQVAREVWKCFGAIFRLPNWFISILQALSTWIPEVNLATQYGICRNVVAAYVLWEIWVSVSLYF